MALTLQSSLLQPPKLACPHTHLCFPAALPLYALPSRSPRLLCLAHKVQIHHLGASHTLEVAEDEFVLDKALEAGLDVPYDCRLGVCMTCPARLVSGTVDQSGGMLSDDVIEKGYALLCVSMPRSDCQFSTIPEEELLKLQLVTAEH